MASATTIVACGSGSGSDNSSEDHSENYGSYISISHPTLGGANLEYSTSKEWIIPGGGAEAPSSADCSKEEPYSILSSNYRITVTNSTNNYSIAADAIINCAHNYPTVTWLTYYPIPLETGENKLIANLWYPPERVSGQSIQIVTREPTTGPVIEQTYPEDENASFGIQFFFTNTSVYALFDSEIDPDTIDKDTFIVRDQNSVPVTGNFEVENFEVEYMVFGQPVPNPDWTYSKVTFIPDFPLPPLANPTVTVSARIKDTGGREMGSDYHWSFRTGPS